jgi:spore maturation protein SpmB
MSYIVGGVAFIGLSIWGFYNLDATSRTQVSYVASNAILYGLVIAFIVSGLLKKLNIFELFIDGAKDGFKTAIGIIPYLIAILVAVGMFRASGAMGLLEQGLAHVFSLVGINPDLSAAVPTAIMKPLSGSGARGLMIEAMTTQGADSLVGRLCCVLQGTTDTTFYVLAVYFGSVGIKNSRHAVACCLVADLIGIIAAFTVANIFFG